MKFLVDAQLPYLICDLFVTKGISCIHTRDLRHGSETTDEDINSISIQEELILITKDNDFLHSFLLHRRPYKLIFVSTGNLRLAELVKLFEYELDRIVSLMNNHDMLELTKKGCRIII